MIQEANLHWRYIDTETNLIMPWYTLPALHWLHSQDILRWDVFEYGAGYSSIWWRVNSNTLDGIEHNESWAKAMSVRWSGDDKENYIKSTPTGAFYDCIVVDGEWRDECVAFSRNYLKSGGYMIIDNYGQTDFPSVESVDKLLEGWEKQVFKQPNHTEWATAVFKKP
jgi:hypothetical protein